MYFTTTHRYFPQFPFPKLNLFWDVLVPSLFVCLLLAFFLFMISRFLCFCQEQLFLLLISFQPLFLLMFMNGLRLRRFCNFPNSPCKIWICRCFQFHFLINQTFLLGFAFVRCDFGLSWSWEQSAFLLLVSVDFLLMPWSIWKSIWLCFYFWNHLICKFSIICISSTSSQLWYFKQQTAFLLLVFVTDSSFRFVLCLTATSLVAFGYTSWCLLTTTRLHFWVCVGYCPFLCVCSFSCDVGANCLSLNIMPDLDGFYRICSYSRSSL